MSVENPVEWMFFLEAFIDDAEELSIKVGFNIRIERRIVPCNVPFSLSFVSWSGLWIISVSYTHLTLPTKRIV